MSRRSAHSVQLRWWSAELVCWASVLGSFFGLQAMSKKSSAQSVCPDPQCPTQDGVTKWNSASSAGNALTVAFIVGGLGLAGAATLWLTAKPSKQESPQVGLGPSGMLVRGNW